MKLHHLRPAEGSKQRRVRVGRGESGRRGKTAGRGTKGLKARSKVRRGFEGGQMPLYRRLPKKGFSNATFRVEFHVVNVGDLASRFEAGATVDLDALGGGPARPEVSAQPTQQLGDLVRGGGEPPIRLFAGYRAGRLLRASAAARSGSSRSER